MELIKCSGCNFNSTRNEDFLEFTGNVRVPNQGGIIGNNISSGPKKENWEKDPLTTRKLVYESDTFRLYTLTYCLKCTFNMIRDHIKDMSKVE